MEVGASPDLPMAESSLSLPICSMESHSRVPAFIQETMREILRTAFGAESEIHTFSGREKL